MRQSAALISATQPAMLPEFGGKWRTEVCYWGVSVTRFPDSFVTLIIFYRLVDSNALRYFYF